MWDKWAVSTYDKGGGKWAVGSYNQGGASVGLILHGLFLVPASAPQLVQMLWYMLSCLGWCI